MSAAKVLDVSGEGVRLQVFEKLYIGELASLRVDEELVPGQIRWVPGDEADGISCPVDSGVCDRRFGA